MPLVKSGSKQAFKTNVKTLMHEIGKSPHVQSREQALAIAYSNRRRYGKKKAGGGAAVMENLALRGAAYNLRHEGMINSSIPGRTDKHPMSVKSGSYILPADIPSALGQGNTMAGGEILKKMFSSGPYGLPTMRGAGSPHIPRLSMRTPAAPKGLFKDGGGENEGGQDDGYVPIIAAGGEYVIHPEVVRALGHGSLKKGHKVLDSFVLHVRKKHIETLKKLPPPKK